MFPRYKLHRLVTKGVAVVEDSLKNRSQPVDQCSTSQSPQHKHSCDEDVPTAFECMQEFQVGIHQSGSAVDSVEHTLSPFAEKSSLLHENLAGESSLFVDDHDDHDISDSGSDFNSPDDVSDSDSDDSKCERLSKSLHEWSQKFHVTQVALSELLCILRAEGFSDLPRDARSLLCTPRHVVTTNISGGEYYHFGIQEGLRAFLKGKTIHSNELRLQVNVDGLPLFKSSGGQFWPILCRTDGEECSPFIVGLFYGLSKPTDLQFFKAFIDEYKLIKNEGFIHDLVTYPVTISCFICDAPARAMLKNVKSHNGYHGCERCQQEGIWQKKMTYPETSCMPRTDTEFDELRYEDHITGDSPLRKLGVGMVSGFVLDYMHLVCLGVMKKLLLMWVKGPLQVRIGPLSRQQISSSLVSMKRFIPREFARRPRSLKDIKFWKATEFRQFLLYTGPVVMLKRVSDTVYHNFLMLHVSISILVDPINCLKYSEWARELLINFVNHFGSIYGQDEVVYNVHSLIHLPDDTKRFGPLDSIAAFPFESFMSHLKRLVRKAERPLHQIVNRYMEGSFSIKGQSSARANSSLRQRHNAGPIPRGFERYAQYRKYNLSVSCIVSHSDGDNCFRIRDSIVLVRNIMSDGETVLIVYQKFANARDFYSYPLPSSQIGIFWLSGRSEMLHVAQAHEITAKYVLLPHKDAFIAIPLKGTMAN